MKLGILQCDDVRQSLQPEFGDYASMFKALFEPAYSNLELHFYRVIDGQFPLHVNECDAYICSGSKWSVNDNEPWIRELEHFIRALYIGKKGLVGICFGHQLIAKALGGEVEKSPSGWGIGIAYSNLMVEQRWMQPKQSNIALVVCHQDQVCKLPPNAKVLLSNDFCRYSMFQVDSHFLGLQGHPEFSSRYSAALMEQRRDIIPATTIEVAMTSLANQADDRLISTWILAFLKRTVTA